MAGEAQRDAPDATDAAERFIVALLASRPGAEGEARQVPLAQIFHAFHAALPHLRGQPQARGELLSLLRALEAQGRLRLPRGARGYDSQQSPALPRWVRLPRPRGEREESPAQRAARLPWHPALQFVRGLPRLTEEELRDLQICQRFLARVDGDEPVLTARERSLRLFGDEKRLDRLRLGQLFQPGRLSASLLRCRFVHAPFISQDFGAGEDALILENHDTYHSACAARRALGVGPRLLIFGCGNAILKSAEGLAELAPRPARILYFGDLDLRGLEIAWELQRLLAGTPGMPGLRCAAACYERLCAFPASAAHASQRCVRGEVHRDALFGLLPTALRERAAAELAEGRRWAQEWITQAEWLRLLPLLHAQAPG